MDIQATKLELMQLLLNTRKERVLARLKEVFEQEETAVGHKADGTPITKAELIDRAKAANEDVKAGRTKSIDQLRKEVKHW